MDAREPILITGVNGFIALHRVKVSGILTSRRVEERANGDGVAAVPRVSEFFGIAIYMYYSDHLPAHFHAEYSDFEAVYSIETLETLRGDLPRRAHSMVVEWALAHRADLRANWDRAREQRPLENIEPLE